MPENEFEKQVQKQLTELQLSPSASVWEKVERQIRERKRRRAVIFFLLPVALGLLAFSWYEFLHTAKKNETAVRTEQSTGGKKTPGSTSQKNNTPGSQNNSPALQPGGQPVAVQPTTVAPSENGTTDTDGTDTDQITGSKQSAKKENTNLNNTRQSTATNASQKNRNRAASNNRIPGENTAVITVDNPAKQAIRPHDNKDNPVKQDATDDLKTLQTEIAVTNTPAQQPAVDKINTPEKKVTSDVPGTDKTPDTAAIAATGTPDEPAEKKKQPVRFKWGIDASGGVSFNNSGTLTFVRSEAAFDRAYYNGTINSPAPVAILPPSPISEGPAFRLGMVGEWQVTERSRVSAGLQYAYYSNRIKIGAVKDTIIRLNANLNSSAQSVDLSEVYQGSQKNNYTNGYHFIRVPLTYHWQINRSRKLPVQWNAGLSFDYLVGTNALLYSAALGGVYYKDNHAIKKMHVNVGTGLSLRLRSNNGNEWVIGPELSFDLNRLVKNDDKQYLMYGGINARLLFPKKKNK